MYCVSKLLVKSALSFTCLVSLMADRPDLLNQFQDQH